MKRIMAVYDSDLLYAERFVEYIKSNRDMPFEVILFTRPESLKEYLLRKNIDVLLCDSEELLQEELVSGAVKHRYLLTEEGRKESSLPCIYKYRAAKEVITDIITNYAKAEIETGFQRKSEGIQFISIHSPVPGFYKQLFAWSLALLSSERKKTLFISLEVLPNQLIQFNDMSTRSLSEFIFYLKEKNPNIILKMKALVNNIGNLAYLLGIVHGMDIMSLTQEDLIKWMEELKLQSDYETIIFYTETYSGVTTEILKNFDYNLILSEDNDFEKSIYREWERQMNMIEITVQRKRFKNIILPEDFRIIRIANLTELQRTAAWSCAAANADCL